MITSATNTCLTFSQLEDYALNRGAKHERAIQYLHISTCELCACAVNGFTAMPFTLTEVNAIHHQVTVKANASHANPLIAARVFIAALCVSAIIGFYHFAESFSQKEAVIKTEQPLAEHIIAPVIPEIPANVKEEKKLRVLVPVKRSQPEPVKRETMPLDELPSLSPLLSAANINAPENAKLTIDHSDVIYIYDLKVADYNGLYFNYRNHNYEIKGGTPAYKQEKTSPDYLADEPAESVAADKVLKSGLTFFSKEKYSKALEQFLLLRTNNPGDQNALFYGGICCFNLGKYSAASKCFEELIKDKTGAFYEEAKWNEALSQMKLGERTRASELFSEIVNEKGFYAKKAGDKLKLLGSL